MIYSKRTNKCIQAAFARQSQREELRQVLQGKCIQAAFARQSQLVSALPGASP